MRSVLLDRLTWLANAPKGTALPYWLPDNEWDDGIRTVAKASLAALELAYHEIDALRKERD